MEKVKEAIILAGGQGTRMLPATIYSPKETLPLIDTPLLNHLIWEACKGGIERLHIVLSPRKNIIIKNKLSFDNQNIIDKQLNLPEIALRVIPEKIEVIFHEQENAEGVGAAMSIALKKVNGPFLLILGDNLLMDSHHGVEKSGPKNASDASKRLIEQYNITGLPCAGLIEVPDEELIKYGVVMTRGENIIKIIEKPKFGFAPSNYILCGRYLFPKNTSEILKLFPIEKFGENQSIKLIEYLIDNGGFLAVKMDGFSMYDSGDPMSWLKSQIDHALRRNDLKDDLKEWLRLKIYK